MRDEQGQRAALLVEIETLKAQREVSAHTRDELKVSGLFFLSFSPYSFYYAITIFSISVF